MRQTLLYALLLSVPPGVAGGSGTYLLAGQPLLALGFGVGLGLVMVAFPEAIITAHAAGRRPHDRGGEYGTGGTGFETYTPVVRGVGVLVVLAGLYFGATLVA